MGCVLCVVTDAVRRNPLTGKASDVEIEERIIVWIRGAVDRKGGRTERLKRSLEECRNMSAAETTTLSAPLESRV